MSGCNHTRQEWTGRSTEVEINLCLQPKGTPTTVAGMPAFHAQAYAIAEVNCLKCGKQIARRSIIVEPKDLEIPIELKNR